MSSSPNLHLFHSILTTVSPSYIAKLIDLSIRSSILISVRHPLSPKCIDSFFTHLNDIDIAASLSTSSLVQWGVNPRIGLKS